MINNLPEVRRSKLRELLSSKDLVRVIEVSNGLSGLIVENAKVNNKEFDAMWLSSLCDSAFRGKPDNEVVDFSKRVESINEIFEVTTKPLIMDGDTGGKVEHFVNNVKVLERLGVSAIIIEDKCGLKKNSLIDNDNKHELESVDVFANKISEGKKALLTSDFMIIARIESFIANETVEDAMNRARAYIKAGADAIMIHSKSKTGADVLEFMSKFRSEFSDIPVVLVPTTYYKLSEKDLINSGANIVIYANHMLRSAYKAMMDTANKILEDENSIFVSENNCASVKDVLEIIGE